MASTFALPNGGVLTYLAREDWDNSGARRLGHVVPASQFERLVMHHTVSVWDDDPGTADESTRMRYLRTVRPDLGRDVPYSFVLFRQDNPLDVVVAEGRGGVRTGAHTEHHNSTVLGCALAGNFETDPWTSGLAEGVRWIGQTFLLGDPEATKAHRDYKATACCGANAYAHISDVQPPFGDQVQEDEMQLTFTERMRGEYQRHLDREPTQEEVDVWVAWLLEDLTRSPQLVWDFIAHTGEQGE